jgi:L-lactate utilization protein LutC
VIIFFFIETRYTKQQKTGGVLLFKAHQEPKSMQGIAKQYPVVVETKDNVF